MNSGYRRPPPVGRIVAISAVLAATLVVALFWFTTTYGLLGASKQGDGATGGSPVVIESVDLIASYWGGNGSDSNYLNISSCGQCPVSIVAGSFTYNVTLTNNGSVTHTLLNITVGAPFSIYRTQPATPLSLLPGIPTQVAIYLEAPASGGSYDLSGAVNTS